jgi:hypothetical protein
MAVSALATGSRSVEALLRVLDRVVPPAAAAARAFRRYALVAAAAAAVIVVFLVTRNTPGSAAEWVGAAVAAALLAAPPVVLFLFSEALRALAELPDRLRALPGTGREHADELGRLAGKARNARGRGFLGLPLVAWRVTRLTASSRELLLPHAPLLPLVSPPFLLLTLAAAAGALLETAVAAVLLLVLVAG